MEFEFEPDQIVFQRELSELDQLVVRFARMLDENRISYVIISSYIAILFGRSRNTEDVGLFIEEMPFEKFEEFWKALDAGGFECLNTSTAVSAYEDYLKEKLAVRFAVKETIIPNFELKFPKTSYNQYSLDHKIKVFLNDNLLYTSELELQIAFKLKLGSPKDFEDARHLYNVFKEHLNQSLLKHQIRELAVEKEAGRILWKKA
jgi:predicted nucleotidyltransferase